MAQKYLYIRVWRVRDDDGHTLGVYVASETEFGSYVPTETEGMEAKIWELQNEKPIEKLKHFAQEDKYCHEIEASNIHEAMRRAYQDALGKI